MEGNQKSSVTSLFAAPWSVHRRCGSTRLSAVH